MNDISYHLKRLIASSIALELASFPCVTVSAFVDSSSLISSLLASDSKIIKNIFLSFIADSMLAASTLY